LKPRLLRSGLTDRVYVVTRYRERGNGIVEAITKYDVTDEFHALSPTTDALRSARLERALADLVYEAGADYQPDEIPLGSPLGRALHALADEPDCPDCLAALSAELTVS
jgi:hypothetical protein